MSTQAVFRLCDIQAGKPLKMSDLFCKNSPGWFTGWPKPAYFFTKITRALQCCEDFSRWLDHWMRTATEIPKPRKTGFDLWGWALDTLRGVYRWSWVANQWFLSVLRLDHIDDNRCTITTIVQRIHTWNLITDRSPKSSVRAGIQVLYSFPKKWLYRL